MSLIGGGHPVPLLYERGYRRRVCQRRVRALLTIYERINGQLTVNQVTPRVEAGNAEAEAEAIYDALEHYARARG